MSCMRRGFSCTFRKVWPRALLGLANFNAPTKSPHKPYHCSIYASALKHLGKFFTLCNSKTLVLLVYI